MIINLFHIDWFYQNVPEIELDRIPITYSDVDAGKSAGKRRKVTPPDLYSKVSILITITQMFVKLMTKYYILYEIKFEFCKRL